MSAEDEQQEDKNIWQELLAASSSAGWNTAKTATSTLVVLGDRVNGKSSVLNKFKDRITDVERSEYILDYSYINVKNKYNLDKDEVVSRMSIWQLDDDNHADLLTKLIAPKDLHATAYVITVDLSKPWNITKTLDKWLKVVEETNEKIFTQLSAEEQTELKLKVSKEVQTFVEWGGTKSFEDAKEDKKEEDKRQEVGEGEAGEEKKEEPAEDQAVDAKITEEDAAQIQIDPAVPAKNLGVPLIIVGTKADFFNRGLAKTGADEKFDFVTQRMRKIALEYGACTVFTTAVGEGANIELLQDYIFGRVLGIPIKHKPKVIGSSEDITIYAPSGFDSLELINSGSSGKSTWNDATKMEEVFDDPDQNKRAAAQDEVVTAMDNETFFKMLRGQLDKGTPYTPQPKSSPVNRTPEGKAEQQKYVKSFFKSLLKSGDKKAAK